MDRPAQTTRGDPCPLLTPAKLTSNRITPSPPPNLRSPAPQPPARPGMDPPEPLSSSPSTVPALLTPSTSATNPLQQQQQQQQQPAAEHRLDTLDELGVSALFASLGFPFYQSQLIGESVCSSVGRGLSRETPARFGKPSSG